MIKNYYTKEQAQRILQTSVYFMKDPKRVDEDIKSRIKYIKVGNRFAYEKFSVLAVARAFAIWERNNTPQKDWKHQNWEIAQRHCDFENKDWGDDSFEDYITADQAKIFMSRERLSVLAKGNKLKYGRAKPYVERQKWDGLWLYRKQDFKNYLLKQDVMIGMLDRHAIDAKTYLKMVENL